MHVAEKLCFAVRHHRFLDNAGWLWDRVRPTYDRVSGKAWRRGLRRVINGTDTVLVAPCWRVIPEEYEPLVWRTLMNEIKPGDVIADVGAYVGLYTIAMANRTGSSGRVVAFEPDSANFSALKEHVELNRVRDRVELKQLAVGAHSGRFQFNADASSESAVTDIQQASPGSSGVECAKLDDVFGDRRVDIAKIDVEGYELQVLQGARTLLTENTRRPRAIFVEVHPFAWSKFGATSDSVLRLLWDCGYDVHDIDGNTVERIDSYAEVVARKRLAVRPAA